MATAAADSKEPDTDESVGGKEDIQRERFCIRFSYLKSNKEVVKNCFVDKLPTHITSIDKTEKKGFETAYGEYKLTFEQEFQTTRPPSLEEDVYNIWFSYKPSTEKMAWVEVLRKKRWYPDSAKSGKDVNFGRVRVIGGSMISPVTFVRHWELGENMSVSFQFETSKLMIEKDMEFLNFQTFILEISFDSIHETLLVHKTDSVDALILTLKSNPKIYEKSFGKIVRRLTAEDTGFDNIGYLSSYCIEFDAQNRRSEVEHILSRLICLGFRVAYIELQTKNPEPNVEILLPDDFELKYAWQCVYSIGFKVSDHLSFVEKNTIEQYSRRYSHQMTKVFYDLTTELIEKPFFHFKDELLLSMRKIANMKTTTIELPPHYSMVARMVLTPTKSLYLPKEPVFQNRLIRKYGEDFFIRVVLRDEDFDKISNIQSHAVTQILERMKTFFKDGFQIKTRHYEFLGCSNSQQREHSFWFFHPHNGITSESIRDSSGELSTERCVASYVSRFGLCFSSTKKTVDVDKGCVEYTGDVKNGEYCFTDGIGRISTKLAKKVAKELQIHPVPSAFQIRFGGCKGVVAQDPTLGKNADILVIRESMKKFESGSNNLEILEVTLPGRLHLNKQVITLLSGLGIPDHVFLKLQEKMLMDVADILLYDEIALQALMESVVSMEFSLIADSGIPFTQEPFFQSLLQAIYHHKMTNLMKRTRIQIPLDKGRIMMGTTDETKTLQSGQVFIRYSERTSSPGKHVNTYEGFVLVTKNPCFHEGDVRLLFAVDVPSLSHMVDCIVFPQTGLRPHSDEMSGSDLDGDMYFVCWDQDLCQFQNKTPMNFPKAEKKQLTREVNSHDMIDFLANYIRYDKLGQIANAHLVHADSNENGIFSEECHRLAKMHSDAVDFPKTGKIPQIDDDLRPKSYPDFMMKCDKQIYTSTKIIGQLFRQCRSLLRMQKQFGVKIVEDEDFILPSIDANIIEDAKRDRDQYIVKVVELLDLYGIKNENEAITGLIQSVKVISGRLKDEKFQVGQIVAKKMCMIQKKTREMFFGEFGGETNVSKEDVRVLRKASAWYKVTYFHGRNSSRKILSFPWTIYDVLLLLKNPSHRELQPSKLEVCLNDFYSFSQHMRKNRNRVLDRLYTDAKTYLSHNLRRNVEFNVIGLDSCGLFLKNQNNLNVELPGLSLETINKIFKKHGIIKINKPIQDPCYFASKTETAYVRFITDSRIVNLSKAAERFFSKRSLLLKPIVQFLLDILQKILPFDSDSYVFCDLIAITIVYYTWSNNNFSVKHFESHSGDQECAKCLLAVLSSFILGFRSWNLNACSVLKDGFDALNITLAVLSEISEIFIAAYHKIAQNVDNNPFLETVKAYGTDRYLRNIDYDDYSDDDVYDDDDDDFYRIFPLPLNVWNTIKNSETYVEAQLSKKTGAEILFHTTESGLNRIQAWGTEMALSGVEEIINNISKTSSTFNLHTESGHLIVENAYSVVFQGGDNDSRLSFDRYHGIHHKTHYARETFIPKLMHVSSDKNYSEFEVRFLQQWNVLRTAYSAAFHGDLFLSISFGTLYVMDIEKYSTLNVFELNDLFTTLDTRRQHLRQMTKGKNKIKVPYTFSFQPVVLSNKGKMRTVLERRGFTNDINDIKTKISIRFGPPNFLMLDYDENGDVCCLKLSEIKWLMSTLVPATNTKQGTNIRFKLQSYRDLDRGYVNRKYKKLLTKNANGYQLLSPCGISYAREKVVETYTSTNWFGGYKLMVEVAAVTELTQNASQLVRPDAPRLEALLLPEIPRVTASDEELKSYTRQIQQFALTLAAEFENF